MREVDQQEQESSSHDEWFRRQLEIDLDSAIAGRLIPVHEAEAKFAVRRAVTRQRLENAK